MTKLLTLLTFCGTAIWAQSATAPATKISPTQVRKPTVPAPSIGVILPSGLVVYAKLDTATLELDTSVSPPILRVKAAPIAPPMFQGPTYHQLTRNSDGNTFTLPFEGKQVVIYRNGLLMIPKADYIVNGSIVRFVEDQNCCESDEVVVAAIYQ